MNRTLKLLVALVAAFSATVAVALAASSPAVSTRSAGSVGSTTAVLRGYVKPNGAKTGYQFAWGLTTAYGTVTATRSAGSSATAPRAESRRAAPSASRDRLSLPADRREPVRRLDRRRPSRFKTKGNPPPYAATGPVSAGELQQRDRHRGDQPEPREDELVLPVRAEPTTARGRSPRPWRPAARP